MAAIFSISRSIVRQAHEHKTYAILISSCFETGWMRLPPCRSLLLDPPKNNAELVPFFLAGLCHPTTGVKKLTAKALLTLGLGGRSGSGGGGGGRGQLEEGAERASRCRELLQPPLLPALVAALGDGDTGAAQAR